jgi:hypothetical protein
MPEDMKKLLIGISVLYLLLGVVTPVFAQGIDIIGNVDQAANPGGTPVATGSSQATSSADLYQLNQIKKDDITKPEEDAEKQEVLKLFTQRPATHLTYTNFIAYFIQYSVKIGVPANTIILILLLPLLASIVAFFRHVVGLPSLGMLVPVALSITLVATGITAGVILLAAILIATFLSRLILKRIRIMQLPKSALSIFILSIFIIISLSFSASIGILTVKQLSIFPVLLLILLSEQIVSLQLERSLTETILITTVTLFIGVLGFAILSSQMLQDTVLLYPETVLFLIPLNLAIGRYFGLRITEYFRFSPIKDNANK